MDSNDEALAQGSDYRDVVAKLGLFHVLSDFDPHLAGSFPLGLDIPGSDLDILCHAADLDRFEQVLCDRFGTFAGFAVSRREAAQPAVVCRFEAWGLPVEVFGQDRPVAKQAGWRHLIVERRLLNAGGNAFRESVIAARQKGLKTEPAFAACLQLSGDPYEALLGLQSLNEAELAEVVRRAGYSPES